MATFIMRAGITKAAALTLIAVSAACFLPGCQPTPEAEAVINKNNAPAMGAETVIESGAEPTIESIAAPVSESAPTTNPVSEAEPESDWVFEKEYDSGSVLEVAAVVLNGDAGGIPVVSIEEDPFSEERCREITNLLCPGYKVCDYAVTKSSYERDILLIEELLFGLQTGSLAPQDVPAFEIPEGISIEDTIGLSPEEELNLVLESKKRKYAEAPNASDLEETDFQFKNLDDSDQLNLLASEGDAAVSVDFVNWKQSYNGSSFYMDVTDYEPKYGSVTDEYVLPGSFENDEAFKQETAMLAQILSGRGADYLTLQSVSKSADGFTYYYTRSVNGLPETYTANSLGTSVTNVDNAGNFVFNDLWQREYFTATTRDGEIVSADWKNPSKIEIIEEDVSVIPWEQARDIFLRQMDYMMSPAIENADGFSGVISGSEIVINRVELGLTKVLVQNSGGYRLVPTWSFCGYDKSALSEEMRNNNVGAMTCFVTVNAMDGSLIDRGLMY